MKLRNKENRVTGKLTCIDFDIDESEKEIDLTILLDNSGGKCIDRQFYSLDELKEFLRDWEEVKDPLIKDEKIRKAVRAWAEAEEIEKVSLCDDLVLGEPMVRIAEDTAYHEISFKGSLKIKCGTYTITELCGNEKKHGN